MNPHFFWIPGPWRGRLAIATRPRGGEWLEDEIRRWRRAGIDIVICLLEKDELAQLELIDESKAAESNGIRFISFPIPDRGVPVSVPALQSLMATVSNALGQGKHVAVHCRQGVGRSGLIAAGVLANSGVHPEQAIKIVSGARGVAVPETTEQRLWVQRLPSSPSVAAR
jgi:protein-tyrosine phosphatase